MAKKKSKIKTANKSQKKKKKVPNVKKKLKTIHLRCTNCAEEEKQVIRCAHCGSCMDVVEVEEKSEEEVKNDTEINDKETSAEEELEEGNGTDADRAVEEAELDKVGSELGDIFGGGGTSDADGAVGDNAESDGPDLTELSEILDQE